MSILQRHLTHLGTPALGPLRLAVLFYSTSVSDTTTLTAFAPSDLTTLVSKVNAGGKLPWLAVSRLTDAYALTTTFDARIPPSPPHFAPHFPPLYPLSEPP